METEAITHAPVNGQPWAVAVELVDTLRALDRQCVSFGADEHRYVFAECASPAEVEAAEARLGLQLPAQLREFYLQIGNGGVGPCYGVKPVDKLAVHRATIATAPAISIIDEGCGHEYCVVASGPRTGLVTWVSEDHHVAETPHDLVAFYAQWFGDEIDVFRYVQSLIEEGQTYGGISLALKDRYMRYDAGDRIVSLLGVAKPAEMFGSGNMRIHHGASQEPWYEQQLEQHRHGEQRPTRRSLWQWLFGSR